MRLRAALRLRRPVCLVIALTATLALPATAQDTAPPPDWTQAVSHMQAGAPAAALPHLENLVRTAPDATLYRLELAYALFQLGRDQRAQYHFRQAQGAGLSAERQKTVASFLHRIEQRKRLFFRFSLAAVPSTNAGRRTSASQIDAGGLIIPLAPNQRAQSATGIEVTGGVTLRPDLTPRLKATLSLDASAIHYRKRVLREMSVLGRAGLRYDLRGNTFIEGGALIGRSFLAEKIYSDRKGVYAAFLRPLGTRAYGRFGLQRYDESYARIPSANGTRTLAEISVNYALTARALLRLSGYALRTDATSTLQSGWKYGASAGTTYSFNGGLVVMADVTAARDKRDGIGALSGVTRRDISLGIRTQIYHSGIQIGPFVPVLKLGWEQNRSNREIDSFSNTSLSIGLTSVF